MWSLLHILEPDWYWIFGADADNDIRECNSNINIYTETHFLNDIEKI